jgi:hypothetical protein
MDAPILRFDRHSSRQRQNLPLSRRVWLEITRGRVQRRIRPVRGPLFLIGSATDCDLVLGDSSFPEAYAYVFVQDPAIAVRRLGLGPELQVADEAVETAELQDGDRLSFGPFELCLHVAEIAGSRLGVNSAATMYEPPAAIPSLSTTA